MGRVWPPPERNAITSSVWRIAVAGIALSLAGCSACGPVPQKGVAWPEADALFKQDPRWLGADGAYSVPLGDGRILWLFGDTFVAKTAANVRSESKMVRNTVAIQRGADPTTASMTFFWRGTPDAPASFFAEDADRWYWPGHGVRIGSALVLFLQRVRTVSGGLGFEADGWRAAIIDDASGDPSQWNIRIVAPSSAPAGLGVGSAANIIGDHVVSLAEREPGDHAGFLVRWATSDLTAGNLDGAEWWTSSGWQSGGSPSQVMANAGPESSVHFDATKKQWVHVRSDGFGASTIVVSFANALEGPWSQPVSLFRPPESDRAKILVYAGKAHPELDAGGALAVTWASNTLGDFSTLVNDTSLYYPRFAKLRP